MKNPGTVPVSPPVKRERKASYRESEDSRLAVPSHGQVPWLVADRAQWMNRTLVHAQTAHEAWSRSNLIGAEGVSLHYSQVDCIQVPTEQVALSARAALRDLKQWTILRRRFHRVEELANQRKRRALQIAAARPANRKR